MNGGEKKERKRERDVVIERGARRVKPRDESERERENGRKISD